MRFDTPEMLVWMKQVGYATSSAKKPSASTFQENGVDARFRIQTYKYYLRRASYIIIYIFWPLR